MDVSSKELLEKKKETMVSENFDYYIQHMYYLCCFFIYFKLNKMFNFY